MLDSSAPHSLHPASDWPLLTMIQTKVFDLSVGPSTAGLKLAA